MHDEAGIIWPLPIAPAHVCVIPLAVGDDVVEPAANGIVEKLVELGLEVCVDDRKERPGVKFAEADLLGWPLQITVGKRGLEAGNVEVKIRATNEKFDMPLASIEQKFDAFARSARKDPAHADFEALK